MDDPVINPFCDPAAALRYAASRPAFHDIVMDQLVSLTGVPHFQRALDLGCGTGQSTRPLATIADEVLGIDSSAAMLAAAEPAERVTYQQASAEQIPAPEAWFDLVTAGLAWHWFTAATSLREVARVLRPGGWLAIYNSAFTGRLLEDPGCAVWMQTEYLNRFPPPPRNARGLTSEFASASGFESFQETGFEHTARMTNEQLVAYLTTQSNILTPIDLGVCTLAEVHCWLAASLSPFFSGESRTAMFSGRLMLMRRSD